MLYQTLFVWFFLHCLCYRPEWIIWIVGLLLFSRNCFLANTRTDWKITQTYIISLRLVCGLFWFNHLETTQNTLATTYHHASNFSEHLHNHIEMIWKPLWGWVLHRHAPLMKILYLLRIWHMLLSKTYIAFNDVCFLFSWIDSVCVFKCIVKA